MNTHMTITLDIYGGDEEEIAVYAERLANWIFRDPCVERLSLAWENEEIEYGRRR